MEERLSRSPGGKLACGLSIHGWLFRLGNGALHLGMSRIPDAPVSGFESDLGSTAESG